MELCDKSVTRSFTIVLIPLAYPLSLTDTQAMEEQNKEAPKLDYMCPSLSPATADFFIFKKKDARLGTKYINTLFFSNFCVRTGKTGQNVHNIRLIV